MKKIFLAIIIVLGSFNQNYAQTPVDDEVLYVWNAEGLSLQQSASLSSKKILKLPYGAKLFIREKVDTTQVGIDEVNGNFIKVIYNNQSGYVPNSYLSYLMPPPNKMTVKAYMNFLLKEGIKVIWGEKFTTQEEGKEKKIGEELYVATKKWEEAFVVAKVLFKIPKPLYFPKKTKARLEVFENPKKISGTLTDELKIERDGLGNLIAIVYFFANEKIRKEVRIEKAYLEKPRFSGMRVSERFFR